MAKLGISTGTVPDDGTGDSLIAGAVKINSNFDEIYNYFGDGNNLSFSSGLWQSTGSGINTTSNVGLGTTNPRFALEVGSVGASGTSLWVNGDARVTGILTVGTASITIDGSSNKITVGTGVTIDGSTGIISATSIVLDGTTLTGAAVTYITAGSGISVDQNTGNVTISATGGGGGESYWVSTAAGIHTLSNVGIGTTNPTNTLTVGGGTSTRELYVTGVGTFIGSVNFGSQLSIGTNTFQSILQSSSGEFIIRNNTGRLDLRSDEITLTTESGGSPEYAMRGFVDGAVELYYDGNKKFETTGVGVTVTGTTFTNQLSVSGVSTLGIVTGATYYGDTSNAVDGRWTLTGDGSNYTLSGIGITSGNNTDPILYFARGRVYEFVNTQPVSHPFVIRDSDGGTDWTSGITTSTDGTNDYLRFEVPMNAPNTLYYQCTVHSGMGNTISVYPNLLT